ncbi:hypothetical protein [Granulicella sibirica]|uniref:Uncharacterized protein n=1 Tax=Granulicella sibirica TaxID=2479048 RepID=A0A4Q0SVV1_9BACT|nr:hypothetical protein [Granulicella sibirica]RXH54532.1 hypothetical protein GRAN_3635 [Granulicella sibirica]
MELHGTGPQAEIQRITSNFFRLVKTELMEKRYLLGAPRPGLEQKLADALKRMLSGDHNLLITERPVKDRPASGRV